MDTHPQAQAQGVEIMKTIMNITVNNFAALILFLSLLASQTLHAEDRVDLQGTSIIGNRELPKILYIAPWKKPFMSELGRPVNSLINEVLSPLERDVMTRTIRYHDQLSEQQKQAKAKK